MVDSSLLRYISAQKESQFFDIGTTPACVGDVVPGVVPGATGGLSGVTVNNPYVPNGAAAATSSAASSRGFGGDATPGSDCKLDATTTTTTSPRGAAGTTADRANRQTAGLGVDAAVSQELTATADEWWLGQYNRHNLAQKLVAIGADVEAAQVAGEAVQRYCLVRTARRRIRIFLRERDSLWRDPSLSLSGAGLLSSSSSYYPDAGTASIYRGNNRQLLSTAASPSMPSSQARSPSYGVDDVFEVMREYGLTGVDICALLTNSPNLALMMPRKSFRQKQEQHASAVSLEGNAATEEEVDTLEDTLERSLNGLLVRTLGLRRYDARKVLRGCPGLLSVRGSKSAVQVMAMMTKLGVSEHSVARDKTSLPVLLSRSPAGIFRLVSFLCSSAVRMPLDQIGPLLRRKDSRQLMDAVIPIPSNVQRIVSQMGGGNDDKDDGRSNDTFGDSTIQYQEGNLIDDSDDPIAEAAFWSKTREERKLTIEQTFRNMTKTALTLQNEIGATDLSKVVAAYPNVLLLDVDRQIMPVARYLMDDLGILEGDLASLLQLYPMLLGLKIDDMKRVVLYLGWLGVEEDELPSIFRAFPSLLTFRIEDMEPVVSYLRSIGVEDVGAFVTRLPPVLGYSVEKELVPKWEFLKTVCMHAEFELRKFPAYFSYPFERVIKTRYEYLAYRGVTRQLIPVDAVLRFGDVDFAVKVARDDDKGDTFRSFAQRRHAAKKQRRQDGADLYKPKKKPIIRKLEDGGGQVLQALLD